MSRGGEMTSAVEMRKGKNWRGRGKLRNAGETTRDGRLSFADGKKKCSNMQPNVANEKKELRNKPRQPSEVPTKLENKQIELDKRRW